MYRIIRSTSLSCLFLAFFLTAYAAFAPVPAYAEKTADTGGWTIESMMKIVEISKVRVSPGGDRVAYAVTRPVMTEDRSEFRTRIYVAGVDGKKAVPFTREDTSSWNPQWSPDGKLLAFASRRSGQTEVYVISATGGEAVQVTDTADGVDGYKWSPSGKMISYLAVDKISEEEKTRVRERNDAIVHDKNHQNVYLWSVPVRMDAGEKAKPRRITPVNLSVVSWDWSFDEKTIVFEHTPRPADHDEYLSDVSLIDVSSGKVTPLLAGRKNYTVPMFSPDGRWISVLESEDPPEDYNKLTILLLPAKGGGEPRVLANTFNEHPIPISWTRDSKALIVYDFLRTTSALYRIPADGGPAVKISTFTTGYMMDDVSLDPSGTMLGFTWQDMMSPQEAYVTRLDNFKPARVSGMNDWARRIPTAKSEVISWKSKDGTEVEGILTYPLNYEKGKKYPLLLLIHGGPAWYSPEAYIVGTDGIPLRYPVPVFASQGYAVLKTNYRGSTGYGSAFRKANIGGWGIVDYEDVMAGVDHVISLGIANPDRLGVMGWSYGGYMTGWIISQTTRFKAASAGAGIYNLVSMTYTTDTPRFAQHYFGKKICEDPVVFLARCAIGHVKNIVTPVLILHGTNDIRVPHSQSVELYTALKLRNVPAEMVSYPRQPHSVREPKLMRDLLKRNLDWFNHHIPVE